MIVEGDCVEAMALMDAESFDAVVCDPPYNLNFMGREWDRAGDARAFQAWCEAWAREALRVLKPGGHIAAFGGTRTFHRLAAGIEDAGFEIRDTLAWMYGQGFPKSRDVSMAIDTEAGAVREVVGSKLGRPGYSLAEGPDNAIYGVGLGGSGDPVAESSVTAPATREAAVWAGWGTALKPAFEPIVLARKPLVGTVSRNVLAHGTGALNIDAGRIDGVPRATGTVNAHVESGLNGIYGRDGRTDRQQRYDENIPAGRWPANVILDDDAAAMRDEQAGERTPGNHPAMRSGERDDGVYALGHVGTLGERRSTEFGGASRFFYCPKTSTAERNAGLDAFADRVKPTWSSGEANPGTFQSDGTAKVAKNTHPTVKPVDLMRWLIALVCRPGGRVLDPFGGSGSTACGAILAGMDCVLIERQGAKWVAEHPDDDDYVALATARVAWWERHGAAALDVARTRAPVADSSVLSLFGDS